LNFNNNLEIKLTSSPVKFNLVRADAVLVGEVDTRLTVFAGGTTEGEISTHLLLNCSVEFLLAFLNFQKERFEISNPSFARSAYQIW
jgi:hypothetical protein